MFITQKFKFVDPYLDLADLSVANVSVESFRTQRIWHIWNISNYSIYYSVILTVSIQAIHTRLIHLKETVQELHGDLTKRKCQPNESVVSYC